MSWTAALPALTLSPAADKTLAEVDGERIGSNGLALLQRYLALDRRPAQTQAVLAEVIEQRLLARYAQARYSSAELFPEQRVAFAPEVGVEQTLRPRALGEYVGQERIVENLKVFIRAARERGEPLDHALFFGPPGLGKTTLAHILAHEMGVPLRTTAGPVLFLQATNASTILTEGFVGILIGQLGLALWAASAATIGGYLFARRDA